MMGNQPNHPSWSKMTHKPLAWVNSILYKDKSKLSFIGFTMPLIDTKRFYESHKYYDLSDRLIGFGGDFTWKHLLVTAMNLSSTVSAIHEKGHRIGDLREKNILISPNALVTLIDCDSFQIMNKSTRKSFFTRVGTNEYLPPELIDKNFKENNYDRYYSDVFALGILIFKLLMNGVHPYQARGSLLDDAPNTQDKIKKGYFAYCGIYKGVEPPNYSLPYDIIPPSIQSLFYRCFVEGHKIPYKRPSANEWYITLRDEAKKIKDCKVYVNHKYSSSLSYCPWCKLAKEKRIVIYPSPYRYSLINIFRIMLIGQKDTMSLSHVDNRAKNHANMKTTLNTTLSSKNKTTNSLNLKASHSSKRKENILIFLFTHPKEIVKLLVIWVGLFLFYLLATGYWRK